MNVVCEACAHKMYKIRTDIIKLHLAVRHKVITDNIISVLLTPTSEIGIYNVSFYHNSIRYNCSATLRQFMRNTFPIPTQDVQKQ
jgi:hypothetical protein